MSTKYINLSVSSTNMERIQVTVSDEAGKVLHVYKEKNKHKSKDDALNYFLLEHGEGK